MDNLNFQDRFRICENRDINNGICLNRAERAERWSDEIMLDIKKELDFTKLGSYYDIDDFHIKYSEYLNVDKQHVLITNGADEAIKNIYFIYAKENDNIMFPTPTYGMYNVYTQMFKCNSIQIDYDNNLKINKEKIYNNLNSTKIFFLPNPNHNEDNFELDEIARICNILQKNNGIMVVDETYYGFGSMSVVELLSKHSNIFIIRSFSKTFGLPGIRIGCLISNYKYQITNLRGGYEISYISYRIGLYFLNNINIINNYIDECIEGRNYLIEELNKNKIKFNGKSGYIFNIIFENDIISKEIYDKLWEDKIYVRIYKNIIGVTISPKKYLEKFCNKLKKII